MAAKERPAQDDELANLDAWCVKMRTELEHRGIRVSEEYNIGFNDAELASALERLVGH